ncbi:MAG TPA: DUF4965 domain-containing protein [Candidatus Pullilachnospira intestinigallinarum]|nr:DUF4965 domain-containing protein [Candidatus Pullilachnospira intestinigallinarum]
MMTGETFLPRAIPLVTVDPYFNIWSFDDHLYDDAPRHWTGKRNAMTGAIRVDGVWLRFMGKLELNAEDYYMEPEVIPQTEVEIRPTRTIYHFENQQVALTVEFMTPLLLSDLKLMSRPVSYVSYQVKSRDGKEHEVLVYLDITAEAAVNTSDQSVQFGKDARSIFCGRGDENMLTKSGDDMRIDWGWLHLAAPEHKYIILSTEGKRRICRRPWWEPGVEFDGLEGIMEKGVRPWHQVRDGYPALGCWKEYTVSTESPAEGFICLAYNDLKSIQYFGENIDAYWKSDGTTFEEALDAAIHDYQEINARAAAFDAELKAEAEKVSRKYYDILSVAYRESIAAHKLIMVDGELKFFSKECYSNGCIGTVDLTYPSMPLYLKYCPQLMEGMMNPIFHLADTVQWPFPYAPHDMGQYPLANGQVYGLNHATHVLDEKDQMPVEESGNMLLCVAAVCKAENSLDYAVKHKEILTRWADYLVSVGWNPENQLCTDDFAGHLAHNCNLSVKGILGIAAWAKLLGQMGEKEQEQKYRAEAEKLARQWEEAAFDGDHYRLTFDGEGTWSLKYNLVWDTLLDLNVFDRKVAETEVKYYLTKMNPYGIPLDSRCDYTKSDWEMWTTMLTDNVEYRDKIIDTMWEAVCDMDRRAPFPDWYHTEKAVAEGFQNRSVQGALFIRLLNW